MHLLRHGEVHNPTGVLYGRLPGYHLSDLGRQMAERVADVDRRPRHRPPAWPRRWSAPRRPRRRWPTASGLEVVTDERVIESTNVFEGKTLRRRRRRAAQAVGVAAPVEPVPAVLGRALQGGRRPDDGGGRTTPATPPAATRR